MPRIPCNTFRHHSIHFSVRAPGHLSHIAGDYRLRAEPDAGQEHLHLLGCGVCASSKMMKEWLRVRPRKGKWRDFDSAALEHFGDAVKAHQIIERIIEGRR